MSSREEPTAPRAHRPEYDGKMVSLPRVEVVEPGDILLTSNIFSDDRVGLKQSGLIRRMTGGRFSHALICSSPPVFVEAIGTGVSTLSLARCYTNDVANVRLLRYPDRAVAREAAKLAQYEIGRDYSVARAVRSVFPAGALDRVDDHGIFCSALVAQVFVSAGASLFGETPVDRTTPATLDKLSALIDLTSTAFRSGLMPRNAETMSALDGDRAPTLSSRQTELSAACARAVWPTVERLVAGYPEARLAATPAFYSILKLLTEAIDRRGAIAADRRDTFDREVQLLDESLANALRGGELAALLNEIEKADSKGMMTAIAESFADKPDIDLDAMQGMLQAGIVQLNERQEAIDNWDRWGPSRSKALTLYLPIERSAATSIAQRNQAVREILDRRGRMTS